MELKGPRVHLTAPTSFSPKNPTLEAYFLTARPILSCHHELTPTHSGWPLEIATGTPLKRISASPLSGASL